MDRFTVEWNMSEMYSRKGRLDLLSPWNCPSAWWPWGAPRRGRKRWPPEGSSPRPHSPRKDQPRRTLVAAV